MGGAGITFLSRKNGGDLLSQALAGQVPSALRGLTSLFGMGRGVSPSLWPPKGVRDQAVSSRAFKTAQLNQRQWVPRVKIIRQALDPLVPVC